MWAASINGSWWPLKGATGMWPVAQWKLSNTGVLDSVILLHAANESSLLKVCGPDEKKPTGIFAPHRCPGQSEPNRHSIPMVTLSFISINLTPIMNCYHDANWVALRGRCNSQLVTNSPLFLSIRDFFIDFVKLTEPSVFTANRFNLWASAKHNKNNSCHLEMI